MTKKQPGKLSKLSNGGSIWLSDNLIKTTDGYDCRYVCFTNSKGIETRLALSEEALLTLGLMHSYKTVFKKLLWNIVDKQLTNYGEPINGND